SAQIQAELFCQWDQRRRAEGVLQPAAEIPIGEQVQTQHGSQIGEGPLRLGEMVHPFQKQHGEQRCPNLNQQRIPSGAHKTLHLQVLFERFEQLNDTLPINNVPPKLRSTTATIPCVHRTCQWSGCTTFTTRSTMSCVVPMARRWPCRPGLLVPRPRTRRLSPLRDCRFACCSNC